MVIRSKTPQERLERCNEIIEKTNRLPEKMRTRGKALQWIADGLFEGGVTESEMEYINSRIVSRFFQHENILKLEDSPSQH